MVDAKSRYEIVNELITSGLTELNANTDSATIPNNNTPLPTTYVFVLSTIMINLRL